MDETGRPAMKDEYRLCVTRGTDPSNRVTRHMKTTRERAEKDLKDYDDLLARGRVNRVWVETRQVGEWRPLDAITEEKDPPGPPSKPGGMTSEEAHQAWREHLGLVRVEPVATEENSDGGAFSDWNSPEDEYYDTVEENRDMADYEKAAKNLRERTYGSTQKSKTWEELSPGARKMWIDNVKSVVSDAFGLIKEDRQ